MELHGRFRAHKHLISSLIVSWSRGPLFFLPWAKAWLSSAWRLWYRCTLRTERANARTTPACCAKPDPTRNTRPRNAQPVRDYDDALIRFDPQVATPVNDHRIRRSPPMAAVKLVGRSCAQAEADTKAAGNSCSPFE
jgi:hypothetical protein